MLTEDKRVKHRTNETTEFATVALGGGLIVTKV